MTYKLKDSVISIIIFCFIAGCNKNSTTNNPTVADVTITADFSTPPTTVKSMVGFVHGMSATQPIANFITDLCPAYWRAGTLMSSIYARINQFGATPILVMGDLYRYPGDNVLGWKQPFDDTTAWKNFVGSVYSQGTLFRSINPRFFLPKYYLNNC